MTERVTEFYHRLSPEYRHNMGWDGEAAVREEGTTLDRFNNERRSAIASIGAEVSSNVTAFWTSDLTVRFGVALPLSDTDGGGNGLVGYVRVGRAF